MANVTFGTIWQAIPNRDTGFGYREHPTGRHKCVTVSENITPQTPFIRALPGTSKKQQPALVIPAGRDRFLHETTYFLYLVRIPIEQRKFHQEYSQIGENKRYPPRSLPQDLKEELKRDLPKYTTTLFSTSQSERIYNLYNKHILNSKVSHSFINLLREMLKTYVARREISKSLNVERNLDSWTDEFLPIVISNQSLLRRCRSQEEFMDALEAEMNSFFRGK